MVASRRGMTLVETMIVGALMTIVGGVMVVMAGTGRDIWLRTSDMLESQTNTQRILNRVVIDLRHARRSSVHCDPADRLTFSRLDDTTVNYVRSSGGRTLTRTATLGASTTTFAIQGVTQFSCRVMQDNLDDATLQRVALTAETTGLLPQGGQRQPMTTSVWIRNP